MVFEFWFELDGFTKKYQVVVFNESYLFEEESDWFFNKIKIVNIKMENLSFVCWIFKRRIFFFLLL